MDREGTVKYNGNHYYSGDTVKGEYSFEGGKHYIVDIITDEFGNEFETKLEVTPPKER